MLTPEAVTAIVSDGGFKRVLLVGGDKAVSNSVRGQLGDGFTYVRAGGSDRYQTSLKMAEFATANGLGWQNPLVATGRDFADALSGAAPAGKLGSLILIVDDTGKTAADEISRHGSEVKHVHVLGGTAAVPQSVTDSLDSALS